jgi:hypothetical protein
MFILRLTPLVLLILAAPALMGCSKKLSGDTSFTQAKKGFEKELSPGERKAAIKQLQTETAGKS